MRLNLFCAIAWLFWMAFVRKLDFQARVRTRSLPMMGAEMRYISDCAFFLFSPLFLWLGKHPPFPKEQNKKIKGTINYIYPFSSFFIFDDDVCVLTKRILLLFSHDR